MLTFLTANTEHDDVMVVVVVVVVVMVEIYTISMLEPVNVVSCVCVCVCVCVYLHAVLDVAAFERVLGPCMDIMKRNIDAYEEQLANIFGSRAAITDLR